MELAGATWRQVEATGARTVLAVPLGSLEQHGPHLPLDTDTRIAGAVAAGLAACCEVQVSYAIGVAEPTSIMIQTFGTGKLSDDRLTQIVRAHFDLTPYGLREMLDLARPIYQKTASYGHFGRKEEEFTWERTDKAAALAAELKATRAA